MITVLSVARWIVTGLIFFFVGAGAVVAYPAHLLAVVQGALIRSIKERRE